MEENDQIKEENLKELKIRQQIWESSPELRDLKVKLRAAYIAKEVAAQITEKRAQAQQEKLEHKRLMDMMEEKLMISKDQEVRKNQEAYEKMSRYREELQNQIIQSKRTEEKYQELIKEKAHIDQIVKSIHEEDKREEEIRMERIEQMKCEIEEFCKMQEAWSLMEKQALDEEDRRIKSYLAQRDQEEKTKLAELKKIEAIKRQIQERTEAAFLSHQIQMNEKRERQEVLHDLGAEELRDHELKKIEEEVESALRKRELLKSSYKQHLEDRKKQLIEEEAKEYMYKQQMLAQFAEEARLEQLTAEKRRLKNLEHRRQVQQLLEEKRKQRADEWEQLKAAEKLIEAEKQQRAQIIEEERIRILKKHATKLLGFLPKNTVSEDDLTHLGSEFLEQFNKLKTK